MINEAGALDVYFEDQIEILVGEPGTFSLENVEAVLTANEVEFEQIEVSN